MDKIRSHLNGESMKVAENSKRRWKTIQLPEELLQRVDVVVAAPELGYTSRAEFIKEAVRLRVEAMERLLRERAEKG
jgi:metal-responsive CopG/Arc/MetJ family transcriptional regulator